MSIPAILLWSYVGQAQTATLEWSMTAWDEIIIYRKCECGLADGYDGARNDLPRIRAYTRSPRLSERDVRATHFRFTKSTVATWGRITVTKLVSGNAILTLIMQSSCSRTLRRHLQYLFNNGFSTVHHSCTCYTCHTFRGVTLCSCFATASW